MLQSGNKRSEKILKYYISFGEGTILETEQANESVPEVDDDNDDLH
jgi:hypothetical protein